jgi:hypothetical protein
MQQSHTTQLQTHIDRQPFLSFTYKENYSIKSISYIFLTINMTFIIFQLKHIFFAIIKYKNHTVTFFMVLSGLI